MDNGGRPEKFKAEQVVEAIRGSGGIKATIAKRLGCHRLTVDRYLEQYATVRQAYDEECETTDDYAESLIRQNIILGLRRQQDEQVLVDSSDSKWWLERRRRDKFAVRQEITGPSGGALRIEYVNDWRGNQNADD